MKTNPATPCVEIMKEFPDGAIAAVTVLFTTPPWVVSLVEQELNELLVTTLMGADRPGMEQREATLHIALFKAVSRFCAPDRERMARTCCVDFELDGNVLLSFEFAE